MKKFNQLVFFIVILCGCDFTAKVKTPATIPQVSPSDYKKELLVDSFFKVSNLFSQSDLVYNSEGVAAAAKGNHDCIVFLPSDSKTEATLYVGHETRGKDDLLGDGGGATIFNVKEKNGTWISVGNKENVDFRSVGGTANNCGGAISPDKRIYTAEEIIPASNRSISKYISDTSDFSERSKYENYGWMVEIDPVNKVATQKMYGMGRYSHEDAQFMPDGKTVYLTNDASPAVFFKFVADQKLDYSQGKLYSYQEPNNWLPFPMEMDSLVNARDVAIRQGATLFIRHEWVSLMNGKMYITETGKDNFDWSKYQSMGGKPATYLLDQEKSEGIFDDPYGRVLEFDPETNEIKVLIEGGVSEKDPSTVFSNPDAMGEMSISGQDYLIICEDIIGRDRNRSIDPSVAVNEMYLLDLSIENPKVHDLKRLLIGPAGSEMTGSIYVPDVKTLFVNIQHPLGSNKIYNKSTTIAITAWDKL